VINCFDYPLYFICFILSLPFVKRKARFILQVPTEPGKHLRNPDRM
jgi:hypothetical protein